MTQQSSRSLARSIAAQGIYYAILNKDASISAIEEFLATQCTVYKNADYPLFHLLLSESLQQFDDLLTQYTAYLQRDLSNISPIEQAILVIAAFELKHSLNVPAVVIINEAVNLAKRYGAPDSYRFINSLVDRLAIELRPEEIDSKQQIYHANQTANH